MQTKPPTMTAADALTFLQEIAAVHADVPADQADATDVEWPGAKGLPTVATVRSIIAIGDGLKREKVSAEARAGAGTAFRELCRRHGIQIADTDPGIASEAAAVDGTTWSAQTAAHEARMEEAMEPIRRRPGPAPKGERALSGAERKRLHDLKARKERTDDDALIGTLWALLRAADPAAAMAVQRLGSLEAALMRAKDRESAQGRDDIVLIDVGASAMSELAKAERCAVAFGALKDEGLTTPQAVAAAIRETRRPRQAVRE